MLRRGGMRNMFWPLRQARLGCRRQDCSGMCAIGWRRIVRARLACPGLAERRVRLHFCSLIGEDKCVGEVEYIVCGIGVRRRPR